MRTTQEVNGAVLDWMRETIPALATGYDHIPEGKGKGSSVPTFGDGSMPDVVVDVATTEDGQDFAEFPYAQIQQAWVRIWRIDFELMVDNADPAAAAQQLRDYIDLLRSTIAGDGNLGGRVQFASPRMTFDFTQPFVRYDDGTKGRGVIGSMAVGELIDVNP
jgi:hypothetical protein